jgi:long-chain fatty acid transport protein
MNQHKFSAHIVAQSITLLCCCVLASTVSASGFRLPEVSVAGTALSNAVVANPDLPGALPYNPAAMAFQKEGQVVGGIVLIQPDISVKTAGGNKTTSQGEDNVPVPNFFITKHIDQQWSWGVGANAPFGLETKWPAGTFGTFGGLGAGALEPEHSKIEMLNLNPNVAYQLNANTSVALGIDYYIVRELIFNTQAIKIDGAGRDYGWNIGLLHAQDNWSVGLSYRSSVKVKLDGNVEAGPETAGADAELNFPSMLQVGGRYKVDDKLAVELDIEKTGWSSFDIIEVNHSNSLVSSNPITSTNNWDNAMAYRLGATYDLSPANQLRAGYARDKTPGSDDFFSARVPGNDRQTFSFGLAHDRGDWTIELSYMFVKVDDRKIAAPADSYRDGLLGGNNDPNGTDAYNGNYKTTAHLFGVGVNTQF